LKISDHLIQSGPYTGYIKIWLRPDCWKSDFSTEPSSIFSKILYKCSNTLKNQWYGILDLDVFLLFLHYTEIWTWTNFDVPVKWPTLYKSLIPTFVSGVVYTTLRVKLIFLFFFHAKMLYWVTRNQPVEGIFAETRFAGAHVSPSLAGPVWQGQSQTPRGPGCWPHLWRL